MVFSIQGHNARVLTMNQKVVAIVVTYNSERQIASCLTALEGLARPVVIDNASSDGTCAVIEQVHPETTLFRNSENLGFAAAVNQGIAASDEPFILLLNPDAYLVKPIDDLVTQCLMPGIGAAAGRLLDSKGRTQFGFNIRALPTAMTFMFETLGWNRLWPSNPVNRCYRLKGFDDTKEQDVEQPAGAFLMLRRDVLEDVGGLDEQFRPLWFEDVDLCQRLHNAGHRIRYVPGCMARHEGAHSLKSATLELQHVAWYGNLLRFSGKHFSTWVHLWLVLVILIGVLGRWFWSLTMGSQNERNSYAKVLRSLVSRALRQ